jgi:HlyD family secretion protein
MVYISCLKQEEKQRKFMVEKFNGGGWRWFLALVFITAAAGGCGRRQPLAYNTTTVARGELTKLVTATGTLNPVVNVTVGSQVSGRISKLNVDFNSIVASNEVIAEIDPAPYQAAVDQADADLANARANLELQQVEANRSSDLFTNKLISGSDFDTAIATLHEAQATVKIKEASLSNALVNLNYCKIVSPVDGVVILRAVELGQTVASSFNTPTIFQIANDLTKMQIDSSVAEADVGGVVEGQQAEFTVDAYPERTFHGTVTQVRNSPTTVNNVVTYDCVIGVTNSDNKLKPGMTANVSVTVAQRENTLTIPNGALRFRPPETAEVDTNSVAAASSAPAPATNNAGNVAGGSYAGGPGGHHGGGHGHGEHPSIHTIYVLVGDDKDQKLQAVQVKTGISDGIMTEVISGLDEGAKVVTSVETPGMSGAAPGGFGGGFPRMR